MGKFKRILLAGVSMLVCGSPSLTYAVEIDWEVVAGTDIEMFFPGQRSWEWSLSRAEHKGAPKFLAGKDCMECHLGEESKIGGNNIEDFYKGKNKPPTTTMNFKAAHDEKNLYLRIEWQPTQFFESKKLDPKNEAKITVIVDNGKIDLAARAGCWIACHEDAGTMPLENKDNLLTKYLPFTRDKITRKGGGKVKSRTKLAQYYANDKYLEYWQARVNRGKAAEARDGFILEKRYEYRKSLVEAKAQFKQGKWVVELTRPLNPKQIGRKTITTDDVLMVAFALHDNYTANRYHYVSLPNRLVFGYGEGDDLVVEGL